MLCARRNSLDRKLALTAEPCASTTASRICDVRLAGLIVLGALGVVGAWLIAVLFGDNVGDRSAQLEHPTDQKLIERGAYVALLGDCGACHTAPGGKPFAGGLLIATPIGAVYATNITPDKTYGIGNYSYGDFERAVRRGVTVRQVPIQGERQAHVAGHEGERARQQGTPAQTPTGPLGHGPDGEPTPQWPSLEAYAEAAGRLSGAPLARNDAERSGVQK